VIATFTVLQRAHFKRHLTDSVGQFDVIEFD